MKLGEIVSCFVSSSYRCAPEQFGQLVAAFEERANPFERDWRRVEETAKRVVFKKGAAVSATADYDGPVAEVQAVFELDTDQKTLTLTVGNRGFPFEPLLAKKRYQRLLERIGQFLEASGAAAPW